MPIEGVRIKEIFGRVDRLRPEGQSWEQFGQDCGKITRWTFKVWEEKARKDDKEFVPAMESLAKIAAAKKRSLDWLVFNRTASDRPYWIIERLASDVQDAVNQALELVPDGRPLRLVRDEGPPPEPLGEDPSEPD